MAFNNSISFTGNITRDPELRHSSEGKPRATFGVAVNEGRGDNERTIFVDCTAFGDLGENVVSSLGRGNRVVVVGEFSSYTHEVTDGEGEVKKVTKLTVLVQSIGPDLRFATAKVTKVYRDRDAENTDSSPKSSKTDDEGDEAPAPKAKAKAAPKAKSQPVEDDNDF